MIRQDQPSLHPLSLSHSWLCLLGGSMRSLQSLTSPKIPCSLQGWTAYVLCSASSTGRTDETPTGLSGWRPKLQVFVTLEQPFNLWLSFSFCLFLFTGYGFCFWPAYLLSCKVKERGKTSFRLSNLKQLPIIHPESLGFFEISCLPCNLVCYVLNGLHTDWL